VGGEGGLLSTTRPQLRGALLAQRTAQLLVRVRVRVRVRARARVRVRVRVRG